MRGTTCGSPPIQRVKLARAAILLLAASSFVQAASAAWPDYWPPMTVAIRHWLNVRDKPGLLHRLMVEIAGGRMSLEGDLSKCKFTDDLVFGLEEVDLLKRNTLYPRQDFVVLRLEVATIGPIFKQIMAAELARDRTRPD
jgi:hypothetical protein